MRLIVLIPMLGLWLLVACSDAGVFSSGGNDADAGGGDASIIQEPAADDNPEDITENPQTEPDPDASIESGATSGEESGGPPGSSSIGGAVVDDDSSSSDGGDAEGGSGGDDPIVDDDPADSPEEPAGSVVQNFSSFELFRCVQRSEIVPCLPAGSIYEVILTRQGYNKYLAEISVVAPGVVGQDECINSPATYVCVTALPQEPRVLEANEIEDVQAAFRAVQVELDSAPGCNPNDTCGVTAFSWDAVEVDDSCEGPRLPQQQAQVLGELLEQLRNAGESSATPGAGTIGS